VKNKGIIQTVKIAIPRKLQLQG